jgi:uncharacterized protein DUF6896
MERSGVAMNLTQSSVLSVLTLFVKRQELVSDALSAIRPDLMAGWAEKRDRPTKEYIKNTQNGFWGKDKKWKYFIHGRGCRLVHTVTNEPIEWDAPELRRFDPYWFANWVEWLLAQETESEQIRIIKAQLIDQQEDLRTFLFNVLDKLQQAGALLLHPGSTNKYELI